jgi:hypothetical protein
MLWKIRELELLLQTLELAFWDLYLVRGDESWHCGCYLASLVL